MHVHPDVARVRQEWLTRVDPHAHTQPGVRKCLLRGGGGGDCVRGSGERDEEGVALRVDFDATLLLDRLTDDPVVLGQDLGVPFPQLVEQPRGALDVGEEEGDGSGRQLPHSRPSEAPWGREF